MATADRQTLDAIFHHPVAHNLNWMDTLRLIKHLGSAIEKADGKYSLTINRKHLIFHRPHSKHHGAKLYRVDLSSEQGAKTVRPYDPHHFLHHLHTATNCASMGNARRRI